MKRSESHPYEMNTLKGYQNWKKNTHFLYDLVLTHVLEWPSLTVEWLPDLEDQPENGYSVQRMILGTQIAVNEPNYLLLAEVQLPLHDKEDPIGSGCLFQNDPSALVGYGSGNGKIQIIQDIKHAGEVNRARHMPQNTSMIATKTVSSDIYLFDYKKHPSKAPENGGCNPDLKLKGHTAEGYGLSWSEFKEGHLLSGSEDAQICLWDINATPTNKSLDAVHIFQGHKEGGVVEDVAWHMKHEYLFGSVGSDDVLNIWDLRSTPPTKPAQTVIAHDAEVTSLAFNPFNEWVVATGSTDNTIKLFDLRKIVSAWFTLEWHTMEVHQLGWSPMNESVLASSCGARKLAVWDLSRIGREQSSEEAKDGPAELLFIHGGHTSKITDFAWNPCEDWHIASTAGDNILQVWQMADHIYEEPDDLIYEEPGDHIYEEPGDHIYEEPDDRIYEEPGDHIYEEPDDHIYQEPNDHIDEEHEDSPH